MHLLGLSGSLRKDSFNTQLVHAAATSAHPTTFTMGDLNLPLYSGDTEANGIPTSVQKLADQIAAADVIVIATPEYNKSLSGVLKNALDWVSRVDGNPWLDKPVGLMSATAGRTGGEMAIASLRLAMAAFNARLISAPNVMVAGCHNEIKDNALINERYQKAMDGLMQNLSAIADN